MNEPIVVLAAGKGTRMHSSLPKVLHQLCGKPMISYVLDVAKTSGSSEIIVVVPKDNDEIKDAIGNSVSHCVQEMPAGTADALLSAKTLLEDYDDVIVMSGDVPLVSEELLSSLIAKHHETDAFITLVTADVKNSAGLGRVVRNTDGSILKIVEQNDASNVELHVNEINAGIYIFKTGWLWDSLSNLPRSNSGEVYLTSIIHSAAQDDKVISSVKPNDENEVLGINNQMQLSIAQDYMRQKINMKLMLNGVAMPDPKTVYIDSEVVVSAGTIINPFESK